MGDGGGDKDGKAATHPVVYAQAPTAEFRAAASAWNAQAANPAKATNGQIPLPVITWSAQPL